MRRNRSNLCSHKETIHFEWKKQQKKLGHLHSAVHTHKITHQTHGVGASSIMTRSCTNIHDKSIKYQQAHRSAVLFVRDSCWSAVWLCVSQNRPKAEANYSIYAQTFPHWPPPPRPPFRKKKYLKMSDLFREISIIL